MCSSRNNFDWDSYDSQSGEDEFDDLYQALKPSPLNYKQLCADGCVVPISNGPVAKSVEKQKKKKKGQTTNNDNQKKLFKALNVIPSAYAKQTKTMGKKLKNNIVKDVNPCKSQEVSKIKKSKTVASGWGLPKCVVPAKSSSSKGVNSLLKRIGAQNVNNKGNVIDIRDIIHNWPNSSKKSQTKTTLNRIETKKRDSSIKMYTNSTPQKGYTVTNIENKPLKNKFDLTFEENMWTYYSYTYAGKNCQRFLDFKDVYLNGSLESTKIKPTNKIIVEETSGDQGGTSLHSPKSEIRQLDEINELKVMKNKLDLSFEENMWTYYSYAYVGKNCQRFLDFKDLYLNGSLESTKRKPVKEIIVEETRLPSLKSKIFHLEEIPQSENTSTFKMANDNVFHELEDRHLNTACSTVENCTPTSLEAVNESPITDIHFDKCLLSLENLNVKKKRPRFRKKEKVIDVQQSDNTFEGANDNVFQESEDSYLNTACSIVDNCTSATLEAVNESPIIDIHSDKCLLSLENSNVKKKRPRFRKKEKPIDVQQSSKTSCSNSGPQTEALVLSGKGGLKRFVNGCLNNKFAIFLFLAGFYLGRRSRL